MRFFTACGDERGEIGKFFTFNGAGRGRIFENLNGAGRGGPRVSTGRGGAGHDMCPVDNSGYPLRSCLVTLLLRTKRIR